MSSSCPAGYWEPSRTSRNSPKPSNAKTAATCLPRNGAVCGDVQASSTGTALWWSATSSHSASTLRMFWDGWLTGERTFPFLLGTGRIRNRWIDKWIMHFMEVNQRTVPPETGGELSLWLRYCRSSNHILLHSGCNHSFLVIASTVSSSLF